MLLLSANGTTIVVLEPGNLRRLKEGEALPLGGQILLMYTPDAEALLKLLDVDLDRPKAGQTLQTDVTLRPGQIQEALKAARRQFPEVDR